MQIISDPHTLQATCLAARAHGRTVGLVPTMGALHRGHTALMDACAKACDFLVVSLFVNPTQFGPAEDLSAYPRTPQADEQAAREHGAEVLFTPAPEDIYPRHADGSDASPTRVSVEPLSTMLCGASRPGHFTGVATVVAKLFSLVLPHVAIFGEKDFQQLAVIRRMAADLFYPTRVLGHPTVREVDGLALSSRNAYLSDAQREQAPAIHAGMQAIAQRVARTASGATRAATLLDELAAHYAKHLPDGSIDYLAIVDPDTLQPMEQVDREARLIVAVQLGRARLIDNLRLQPPR